MCQIKIEGAATPLNQADTSSTITHVIILNVKENEIMLGNEPFTKLPDELMLLLLSTLTPKSIALFGQTNKRHAQLMDDPFLWRDLLNRDAPSAKTLFPEQYQEDPKTLYQRLFSDKAIRQKIKIEPSIPIIKRTIQNLLQKAQKTIRKIKQFFNLIIRNKLILLKVFLLTCLCALVTMSVMASISTLLLFAVNLGVKLNPSMTLGTALNIASSFNFSSEFYAAFLNVGGEMLSLLYLVPLVPPVFFWEKIKPVVKNAATDLMRIFKEHLVYPYQLFRYRAYTKFTVRLQQADSSYTRQQMLHAAKAGIDANHSRLELAKSYFKPVTWIYYRSFVVGKLADELNDQHLENRIKTGLGIA